MARRYAVLLVVAALAGGAGCDDGTTNPPDEGVPEELLQFLRFPADLAPIATTDTTFWALADQDRILILRYVPEAGESEGEEFLEFRIRSETLWRRPDGSAFAPGDSIPIQVTVDPDGRFLFRFAPSGLQFNPEEPAELKIRYERLGGDLDGDGDVDGEDDDIEAQLRLWKQEAPGEPWYPVGIVHIEELDEILAEITSFTGFAIAL